MADSCYDAIIIGGGPGGSSAATLLARAGKRVVVLEKEHFPRFHIGESLLPYNRQIFGEMGVLPTLEAAGFPTKLGAQFHLGNSSKSLKLVFKNGCFTRQTVAIQVERAKFDHLLLKHAASSGAEVREGWTVSHFSTENEGVTVQAKSDNGQSAQIQARFLIDASGRANMTGNQEGLRVIHPSLKKLAVFGHFAGVLADDGPSGGDTIIVRLADKWFWLIPVSKEKTSVGCVMDQQEFANARQSAADVFNRIWQSSSEMRARMKNAKLVNTIQTTGDFSYCNRRLIGTRLMRIGDAAGFMDPIFSAGVFLAMHSGKLASQVVLKSLTAGDDGSARLRVYEKTFFHDMQYYWKLVEGFYTRPFMELLMEPRPRYQLKDAILAILAGEVRGGWQLEWRRRLFFFFVKIQGVRRLVPGISFEEKAF